jgi:hypothetical protein
MPLNPLSLVSGGLQTLGGLAQTFTSGVKKKEKALEDYNNSYSPNQSILDYYQKAYSRYDPNAYNSAAYRKGQTNINSNMAAGISATQDRRSGLAGISNLVAQSNRAALNNVANAEAIQGQNLNQLGQATNMKANEDRGIFERKYNLLAMKAGAAAKQKRDGMQNIFGGLSNIASLGLGGGNKEKQQSTPSEFYY